MQPYLVGSRCACQSDLSFHLWRRHESVLANKRKKFVSLNKTLVCNFFNNFFHTLKMILLNKVLLTLNAQYWQWRFSRVCYCFDLHDNEGSIFFRCCTVRNASWSKLGLYLRLTYVIKPNAWSFQSNLLSSTLIWIRLLFHSVFFFLNSNWAP